MALFCWAGSAGGKQGNATLYGIVNLQSDTPGQQQTGHTNVSGTMKAGQFVGGGSGLTNVNADLLDGLDSTSFLQSVPVPLTLTGTSAHIIRGENSSASGGAVGLYGTTTSASGVNYGVFGHSASTSGYGVAGVASAATGSTYGVYGQNSSTSGRAVFGAATAATGTTYGGYFQSYSSSGYGVLGVASADSGTNFGVYGSSHSTSGRAVFGEATAATGITYGGYFESESTSGRGVFAWATPATGATYAGYFRSDSTSGVGVYGWATAASGTIYGVYGSASTAAGGYGVYPNGDLGASGTKSFRIDHPFDPENKYLLHYAAESPFPQNFYVGNVVTDSKGYAWVELPDYFAEINTNFKYQLTVVDDADSAGFVMAKVSKKIRGTRFQIRTSEPNVEVSWRVDADRNDLYVRYKKPKDVVEKQDLERGTYQLPELYGMPPQRGMDYEPKRATRNSGLRRSGDGP